MALQPLSIADVGSRKADEPEPFASIDGAIVGVELEIDDIWKAAVKKRLKEMGQRGEDLAAHIGCSQGNISQTLGNKRKQKSSAFAHAISLATGVPLSVEAMGVLVTRLGIQRDREATELELRGRAKLYGLKII